MCLVSVDILPARISGRFSSNFLVQIYQTRNLTKKKRKVESRDKEKLTRKIRLTPLSK